MLAGGVTGWHYLLLSVSLYFMQSMGMTEGLKTFRQKVVQCGVPKGSEYSIRPCTIASVRLARSESKISLVTIVASALCGPWWMDSKLRSIAPVGKIVPANIL